MQNDFINPLVNKQLVHRVMLFAPEKAGGSLGLRAEHPKLTELQKRLEAAVEQLCSLAKVD